MKARRLTGTLFRYIVSYLAVLMLPVVIVAFFSYSVFIRGYQDEVIDGQLKTLEMRQNEFESKLSQMESIVAQLEDDRHFFASELSKSIISRMDLIRKLFAFRATSGLHQNQFDEIAFYYHGDALMYTASGSFSFSNYGTLYHYEKWDNAQMQRDILGIEKKCWIPAQKVSNLNALSGVYMTFLFSFPRNSADPYGTLLFRVSTETMFDDLNAHMIVSDYTGQVLYCNANDIYVEELLDQIQDAAADSGWFTINNRHNDAMLVTYTSSKQGWVFVQLTEKSEALVRVTTTKNVFSFLLLTCVFLGSLMLMWFSRVNYRPLRLLQGRADLILRQYPDEASVEKRKNQEILSAHKALDVLSQEQDRMTRRVKRQLDILRDFLLIRLISGEFETREEFNLRAKDAGLSFAMASFCVAVVYLINDAEKQAYITELLSDKIARDGEGYAFYIENSRIALLLSGDDGAVSVRQVSDILEKEGITFQIGVGNYYRKLSEMHLSFIEAQTVLGCISQEKENHVAYFRNVFKMRSGYYAYPENEMREITMAIRNKDGAALRDSLDRFYAKQQENYSPVLFKAFAYGTLNTILKATQSLPTGSVHIEKFYERIIAFNLVSSAQKMWEILKEISEDIIANELSMDKKSAGDIACVLSYIKERFDRSDFSIGQTAAHFGLSTSSFTQTFKRRTGQTPISYVNTLKINRARELLSTTNLTITEIIARVGSYDESGFIRKFKEATGTTPGEYRKKYGK